MPRQEGRKWCTRMLRFVKSEEGKNIVERKKRLRAYMKERRGNNENRDVKERLLVQNVFAALNALQIEAGKNVFCYLSYSSEAPTDDLIESLSEKGYRVYCPRVDGNQMRAIAYGKDFSLSKYRIREPIGEPFDGEMHVAVVPFLAVDEKGNRLGYGGGYYDRYFAQNPQTKRVAYGFDFQVQENVPTEDTDKPMDCIVTDKRVIYINRLHQ